jgi:DNA-binding transcriptional ArsR family regulator
MPQATTQPQALDEVFAALADPSRREILRCLSQGEATVGTVAEPLNMALPSVSKHVKVLERAGLVRREVRGREHWLHLVPDGFATGAAWFEHYSAFWSGSADRLAALVADLENRKESDNG